MDEAEKTTFIKQRVLELANKVAPMEVPVRQAWRTLEASLSGRDVLSYFAEVKKFNEQFASAVIDELADATGNSRSTFRSVFAPKDEYCLWFNLPAGQIAHWLRDVAEFESFNESYIARRRRERAAA